MHILRFKTKKATRPIKESSLRSLLLISMVFFDLGFLKINTERSETIDASDSFRCSRIHIRNSNCTFTGN